MSKTCFSYVWLITLDFMKSSEIRKSGDQSNYITPVIYTSKDFLKNSCTVEKSPNFTFLEFKMYCKKM